MITQPTQKAVATRQTILDTGYALVLRKGFAALGLQEILQASGVPKGSFYHYFASKEAFGCALLESYVSDYGRRVNQIFAQDGTGRERLMRYWHAWLDGAEDSGRGLAEDCLAVKLAAEVADLSEDMRRVLHDGVERLIARIAAMIDEARADGSLPDGADSPALAQVLYQMWLGAALMAKLSRDRSPMHRALAATERLLDCATPATAPHRTAVA